MKVFAHLRQRSRRGWLIASTLLATGWLARAEEEPVVASPQVFLELAARTEAKSDRAQGWRTAGLKSALLIRHGRLVPEGLVAADQQRLAEALQFAGPETENPHAAWLASLPLADELVFDGQRYAGANLSYIDGMIGATGRPIAFDREVPTLLVPLTPAAEASLVEKRAEFQADANTAKLREQAEATYGAGAGTLLLADGQFLRAYAGRFDDLYFHLFQNGNAASALAFCGLADGLGQRAYRPLAGLIRRDAATPAAFDLSDILAEGGKSAVRRYLQSQAAPAGEPFQGFAFRVLPSVVAKARKLPAGTRFTASRAEIARALQSRQHLYPTRVPPLYRTPDRFLGWTGSFFLPVANGPALPPGAADSWYPLPESDGQAASDQTAESAASARLFESSSTPDIVWEDPQLSNLLADPEPAGRTSSSGELSRGAAADPRRRAVALRWIAVVTPTAEEAAEYLTAIAASDTTLRTIEQARGRMRLVRQFITSGREATSPTPEETGDVLLGRLQQAVATDLAMFERLEKDLTARMQDALRERAALRSALEDRLTRDRVAHLRALGEKPVEPGLTL